MAAVRRRVLFLALVSFLRVPAVFAADDPLRAELNALKARIQTLETQVDKQEKTIQTQQTKFSGYEARFSKFDEPLHREEGAPMKLIEGLEIAAGGTLVIQGSNNINNASAGVEKKVSRTDASYSADITFGKEFSGAGGKVFLHLEAGDGAGLGDDLTLYASVNRDAGESDNGIEVTEFWYEQLLARDRFAVTFGKLDPTAYFDNNEAANDETTQFLGCLFRNSPVIEFPDNTAGVRLAYAPGEWLEIGYGIFDGNSDWEKAGDNLFNIGQAAFRADFFEHPGNYRFLGWHSKVPHTRWRDTAQEKEAAYGFGLSFDQEITETAVIFCRYGWQNPGVYNPDVLAVGDHNYSLEQAWSAGLQVAGRAWGREADVLAFALGQAFASGDYKKAGSSTIAAPAAKPEGHLEAYYRFFVNDHLSISPDVQYIWNPFGKDVAGDTHPVFVAGIRTQVDF